MEGSTTSDTPQKKDSTQESLIGANWPSLPVPAETQEIINSQDSPIQPAQKSPTAWKGQQRGPADFERDRVGRYAKYFKGNEILPIPELVEKLTPRILSLVVSDLKTKKLVGLNKDIFEELVRKAGIHANTFAVKVLRHGMSCCPLKNRQRRRQQTTLSPNTSGYSRSIGGPVGCASRYQTSRPSSLGRFWPPI